MAEIEITLPTVQYGNVKAKFSPEEFGLAPTDQLVDPTALGIAAAIYLNLFTQGFKVGASMDVTASPSEATGAPVSASKEAAAREAQRLLDEGLGGVTELPGDGPENMHGDPAPLDPKSPPWNSTVDAKPKPWETEATAPKAVVTSEW